MLCIYAKIILFQVSINIHFPTKNPESQTDDVSSAYRQTFGCFLERKIALICSFLNEGTVLKNDLKHYVTIKSL